MCQQPFLLNILEGYSLFFVQQCFFFIEEIGALKQQLKLYHDNNA